MIQTEKNQTWPLENYCSDISNRHLFVEYPNKEIGFNRLANIFWDKNNILIYTPPPPKKIVTNNENTLALAHTHKLLP